MILEYLQTYEWQQWNFCMILVKFTQMGAAAKFHLILTFVFDRQTRD